MIYLQTRSAHIDYNFFTPEEVKRWWSQEYAHFFEDGSFNLFMEIHGDDFRVYIGRIPCGRKDEIGTAIAYTFAGEGQRGDTDGLFLYHTLRYLLSAYKDPQDFNRRLKEFGVWLDTQFGEGYFDSLDENRYSKETEQRIRAKLEALGEALKKQAEKHGEPDLPDLTPGNTAGPLQKDRILPWLSVMRRITDNAGGPALLVITSLPLGPAEVTAFMGTYWKTYPGADTLWLSSDENSAEFSIEKPIPPPPPEKPVSEIIRVIIGALGGAFMMLAIMIPLFIVPGEDRKAVIKDIEEKRKAEITDFEARVKGLEEENTELQKQIQSLELEKADLEAQIKNQDTKVEKNG